MKKIYFAALSILVGCTAPPPTQQELAAANYGPPPKNYKATVMMFMGGILKDPESARYGFYIEPAKGYMGASRKFGWATCATINAKNSFGGYVGAKLYFLLIRNDVVVDYDNTDGKSYLYDREINERCASLQR
jgi:hypothetical protein